MKITPKQVRFISKSIEFNLLLRAFDCFKGSTEVPIFTYNEIEEFIKKNSNGETDLMVKISGNTNCFMTMILRSNECSFQYYTLEEGFNKIVYTLILEYPNKNSEKYEEDFFKNDNFKIVYGFLHSIKCFGTNLRLGN